MAAAYARRPGPIASPAAAVFCESAGITVPSMPSRWRSRTPGVVLASVLVAAGCGGGDDTTEGAGPGPTPLERYFDSVNLAGEGDVEDMQRVEQQTADCMREQGYEYVPLDLSELASDGDGAESTGSAPGADDLPPGEFAERYGYGMFTTGDQLSQVEAADPNAALTATMTDADLAAWDEALYGRFDETTGESITLGCAGQAAVDVYGDAGATDEEFRALLVEMDALWTRIDTDPRVAEAARDWVDCMTDAGYPGLSAPEDAPALVEQRFDQLVGDTTLSQEAVNGTESVGSVDTGLVLDESVLAPEDRRALRDYEIAVATTDFACQEGDGRYRDVVHAVTVEVERRFLAEHREELDRYGEALASAYRAD